MYHVYVIQSVKNKTYYIGYTKTLQERIKQHNQVKTKSIRHKRPFKLIYIETYCDKTVAKKQEIELKKNSFEKEKLLKRLQNSARHQVFRPMDDHPKG